jgi:hypothetical protein
MEKRVCLGADDYADTGLGASRPERSLFNVHDAAVERHVHRGRALVDFQLREDVLEVNRNGFLADTEPRRNRLQ